MLRFIVFVLLFSFSKWLWASSSCAAACCPMKPAEKTRCPLPKKLYVELGLSKVFGTHLSSDQVQIVQDKDKQINFGIDARHQWTGIFPDTLQIGLGYAWFRNSAHGEQYPYASVGVEYRQMNAIHPPITLTAKVFGVKNKDDKGFFTYQSIPLRNSNLFATIKVNPFKIGDVLPYVSAGLGVAWIQAHNQQLDVLINQDKKMATAQVQLPAIQQTNLGFRLGSGFDYALSKNLFMSIGYSYHNLGKLIVSKPSAEMQGQGLTTKDRKKISDDLKPFRALHPLHLGSLTTHNIEFSLRYLFS